MSLTNNQPETLPPATDYFRFLSASFILHILVAYKAIIDAIRLNNYAFAILLISLFVFRFVLRVNMMKFVITRKQTGWLTFDVMVNLDIWVMATFCLSMFVEVISHVDPFGGNGKMIVLFGFVSGLLLCGWIVLSLILVYDLAECWRSEDGGEQKVAAGNVDKIAEKML